MWGPVDLLVSVSRLQLRFAGFRVHEIDAPRGPLTYYEGGAADAEHTVVLVHGMGHQAGSWTPIVKPLVETHRVLIPDLPGHGKSAPSDGPLHLQDVLDGLVALLATAAAPERVTLVGNSMGGWVSLLYAHAHPERVERVISENGGGLAFTLDDGVTLNPSTDEEMRALLDAVGSPVPADWMVRDLLRSIQDGPAPRLAETADGSLVLDGKLGELSVPVELIWGARDRVLPVDYARRMAAELSDARLHLLEDCGHVPHQQCPARFLEALLPHLGEPSEAAA